MKNFTYLVIAILLLINSIFVKVSVASIEVKSEIEINFAGDYISTNNSSFFFENDNTFSDFYLNQAVGSDLTKAYNNESGSKDSIKYSNSTNGKSKIAGASFWAPSVAITPSSLNFGTVRVGQTSSGIIQFHNNSGVDVEVNVLSNNTFVHVNPTAFIAKNGTFVNVNISMEVTTEGSNYAQITFNTNSPSYPQFLADVYAQGFLPSKISVSPNVFNLSLKYGEVVSKDIDISNSGAGVLNYSVSFELGAITKSTTPQNAGLYAGLPRKERSLGKGEDILATNVSKPIDIKNTKFAGEILNTINLPGVGLPTGMVWINDLLYIVDYGNVRLSSYNPNDGTVNIISGLHSEPYGLAWDGSYLWIGNNSGIFYAYNLNGSYAGLSFQGPIVFYSSICFNEGLFYISGLMRSQIYKVDYTGAVQWSTTLPGGITGSQIMYVKDHNDGKVWAQPETGGLVYQISNDFSSIIKSVNNGFAGSYDYALTHNGRDIYSASGSVAKVIDDGIVEMFLGAETTVGSVESSSSQKFSFNVDASSLSVGNHTGSVVINSNDLDNPQIKVPVYLTVTGQPAISVSQNNIDFGNALVNTSKTVNIVITNTGGEVLTLSNITKSIPELSYAASSSSINPGQSAVLTVYFSPNNIQNYSGIISFNTNDPNNPTYTISAQGIGSKALVKFSVKDGLSGNAVDNAVITFNGVTYEDGEYSINNISAGNYSYSVSANGYNTYSGSTNVNQFEVNLNIGLIPAGASEIIMNNGTVISNCQNAFYDPGYTGNYANNLNRTLTILPPNPESAVKVDFQMFYLESGWDYLYVYDGTSTSAPHLGTYSGTSLPPTFTATNPDGALTFRFYTDGSVVYAGWLAYISCVDRNSIAPLSFNIYDANSMAPIPNAYISIEGLGSGYTDLAGNFSFGQVSGGNYSYSVLKEGYFESVRTVFYPGETSISIGLNSWPDVTFIVKDPSGNPVSNALVEIGPYSGNTDISGEVVFSQAIPFNNYSWTVSAAGFQPISGEQFLGNESIVVNANFAVSLPTIRFNVINESSAPFANAQVTLDGNTIYTDGAGQATFQLSEPFLSHSWNIMANGYKSVNGEQYAGTGLVDINIQLQLDIVDLTVTILDASTGVPLKNAVLVVNSTRYKTDDEGKLLINGVPKGNYDVIVLRHAYNTFDETVTVSSNQLEISLDKIQSVSLPFSESFNTGIPSNFSVYDVQVDNYEQVWSRVNDNNAGGTFGELNAHWRNDNSIVRMVLPPINTTGQNPINVSFRHYFNDYFTGMKVLVETSTNGNDWIPTGWEVISGNGNVGPEQITIQITPDTNSETIYIAFTLDGDLYQLDDWYIDDIQITQPGTVLYNASFTVYDNSNSAGVSGAQVSVDGYGALLTNDAGIAFFTGIPNGTYGYTVSHDGYTSQTGSITINNGNVTTNVALVPLMFYSLTINVLDAFDYQTIEGAIVSIPGVPQRITDFQGRVVFTNLPMGTYTYTISKEGYNNYSRTINLNVNRTYTRYLTQKYFNANFTVIDVNSNPVPNALISIPGKITVATSESGQATIGSLENANYNFTIQKSGFTNYSSNFNISGTNSSVNAILSAAPPVEYTILFRVTDLNSSPISNATVLLSGFGPASTNVNGEILYSNITAGASLSYEVQKANYLNSTGVIGPMNENKQITVVVKPIVVEKYQATFSVTDVAGTPLAGAVVDMGAYGSGSTNGAGNVTISNIEFTELLPYQVSLAGYKTVTGNATIHGNTNINVILPLLATTTYSVTFSVTNSTGGYVKDANVYLAGYGSLTTNTLGSAVFNQVNPQNGIAYTVSKPPYANLTGTVNVVNANIAQNLILNTNVYRALFTVIDQFGNPYEGINIDVLGQGSAVTNSFGTAIVGGLSAGTYSYNAYKPNETPLNASFDITNSDKPVEVTLVKPVYSVTFTVKNESGAAIENASVELYGYGVKQTGSDGQVLYTNIVSVNNLPYKVVKSGYTDINGVVSVVNTNVSKDVVLNMLRYSVQFAVTSGSKSITDAVVTFNSITNPEGSYLFTNVLSGTGYNYSVSRSGYNTLTGSVNVADYTNVLVDLVEETFPVTFSVAPNTTKSVKMAFEAKILISGKTDTLTVGSSGQVMQSLPRGHYSFKIWATGYQPYYGTFDVVGVALAVNVKLDISTGFDDNYLSKIRAYPNPFSQIINLDNSVGVKQIIVSNLIGQPVIDKMYSNNQKIVLNTNELLPGVYFVKVIGNDSSTRVIRMIKN